MRVLPLGSVKAEGWLLRQLEKQRDGLTGHAERLYDDIGKSDWLTGERKGGQYAWERGPYYAKGLVALALVLDDPTLKARAKRWVDAVLASQRPDGDFGPKKNSWWANMIALHFLRDWGEATGEVQAADDLEVVAFNSLPAALGDDGRGCRYYLLLNQPQCVDDANLGYHCNPRGDASTPSLDPGFGCCRSNFHFAWPKFTQSLWMEREGGLAAVAYAPSVVKTARATVRTAGSYPLGDNVRLEIVSADGTAWPLFVRLPGWTANGRLAVNGVDVDGFIPGRFVRLDRTWRAGDVVTLELPAAVTHEKGNHDSVAVRRGLLVYCARVESAVTEIARPNGTRGIREDRTCFPIREYRPVKPRNLVLCTAADAARFVLAKSVPDDPFAHGAEPCWLTVSAGRTDFAGWGSMETCFTQRAVEPPPSLVPAHCVRDIREVRLVPLGATQTRITCLPWRR